MRVTVRDLRGVERARLQETAQSIWKGGGGGGAEGGGGEGGEPRVEKGVCWGFWGVGRGGGVGDEPGAGGLHIADCSWRVLQNREVAETLAHQTESRDDYEPLSRDTVPTQRPNFVTGCTMTPHHSPLGNPKSLGIVVPAAAHAVAQLALLVWRSRVA